MKKRIVSVALWFYAGWYLGAMVAFALGTSIVLGPIIGICCAVVAAGDPRRVIGSHRATTLTGSPLS